jgi:3,4-dihydroxy 2-butanone 4-phosphate synthase/GTP cyclohydrolase II
MAQPGGVLIRPGHTEAGCDLARLAGLEPASVIVEILNDAAEMPVVTPVEASIETVKLVPLASLFCVTMSGKFNCLQRS